MKREDLSMILIQSCAVIGVIAIGSAMIYSTISNGKSRYERLEDRYVIEIDNKQDLPDKHQQYVLAANGREVNEVSCFMVDDSHYVVTDTSLMNRLNFDIPDYLKDHLGGSANTINLIIGRTNNGGIYGHRPYILFRASNQTDFNLAIHQSIDTQKSIFDDIRTLAINTSKVCQMAVSKK